MRYMYLVLLEDEEDMPEVPRYAVVYLSMGITKLQRVLLRLWICDGILLGWEQRKAM